MPKAGPGGSGLNDTFLDLLFIRAAALLPRVRTKFDTANVEGESRHVWTRVEGKARRALSPEPRPDGGGPDGERHAASFVASVLDFRADTPEISVFARSDHGDLFDASRMVADGSPIRTNRPPGKLFFWVAA
jgi:hypothetical protein